MKYLYKAARFISLFVCCNLILLMSGIRVPIARNSDFHKQDDPRETFKDRESIKRSNDERFIFRPDVCADLELTLVICVISERGHFVTRETIRQTWGSFADDHTAMVFVLGSSNKTEMKDVQTQIDVEFKEHGDVIQGTFVDAYKNLTLKSIFAVSWATDFCSNAKFYLKADDDAYVNIPLLITALHETAYKHMKDRKFILGHARRGGHPVRQRWHKWYVPSAVYPNKTFPDYTSGGATYAMSMSAVKAIAHVIPSVPQINLEDVYITGMCALKANVTILNDDRIQSTKVTSKEKSTMDPAFRISGGDHNVEEIKQVHALVMPVLRSLGVI